MNTQRQKKSRTSTIGGLLLAGLLSLASTPIVASDDYQLNALFAPSESQLRAEAKGRVMIYDGLDVAQVDKAMDEQFGRIDNMMFVRTHHPLKDGGVEVENDGCD